MSNDPAESLAGLELTLDVGPVAHGGHCVARHEGRVVFVRHALPGERVVANVTDGAPGDRFLRADVVTVLRASPDRVPAPCPYAGPGRCGGCDLQHVSLSAQRRLKADVVREQLERIGRLDAEAVAAAGVPAAAEELPGTPDGLGWRTRVELTAGPGGRAGLRRHRSYEVVAMDRCLIAAPGVQRTGAVGTVCDAGVTGLDVVAPSLGAAVVVPLPESGPVPAVHERVSTASGWEATFALSARGFWQVHPAAASIFVDAVLATLKPRAGERAVDLYAGVGLFTAALADAVGESGQVVAVEADARAVPFTRDNLAGLRQAVVVAARVEDALGVPRKVSARARSRRGGHSHRRPVRSPLLPGRTDLVVLDPPRTGAGGGVVSAVAAMRPRAVAYVACDPAALARDVGYLAGEGYHLAGIRVLDAFPMTHHVECVAGFEPDALAPLRPPAAESTPPSG